MLVKIILAFCPSIKDNEYPSQRVNVESTFKMEGYFNPNG